MTRPLTPSLTSLRAFEAYARRGRLVDAADELCVTHGAVSRQIKQLERQLGVQLLTGSPGKITLTPEAIRYARDLTRLFDEIESASCDVRQGEQQRLQILSPASFAMRWLIPRVRDFRTKHPQVDLDIVDSSGPWSPAVSGPHGAIRIEDYEGTTSARARPFLVRRYGPVISPTLCAGASLDLEQLLALPRLRVNSMPVDWDDWACEAGVDFSPALSESGFGRSFHMLEAAVNGLGACIADEVYVSAEIDAGRLIAPVGFLQSRRHYQFLRGRDCRNRLVSLFEDWLIASAQTASA